ncbi:ATP-binding protein [Geoalkalibacter sp.]|uniref:ATP-binding protein n=1 Tax=Geoalkalibacter sp. TaxID=3041440 RepID=UPI00272EB2DC|nr:ATP-binding protein [Geoalkalibacter sp.]
MPKSPHYAIKGLRKKILLSSVVYTLLALLSISAVSIYPFCSWLVHFEENDLVQAAKIRALAVEEYLARMAEITRQINSRSAIRQALADYRAGNLTHEELFRFTSPILTDALEISEEVVAITRLDAQGRIVARSGEQIPDHLLPALISMGAGVRILDPLMISGQLSLPICGPILDRDRKTVLGYDLVLFSTTKLQRILWDATGLGETGESFLARFAPDADVFFFPSRKMETEIANGKSPDSPLRPAIEKAHGGESGVLRASTHAGEKPVVVAYAPVDGVSWALLVTMDEAELRAPVRRQIYSTAGLVLVLTTVGTLGMLALLRPMTGRVLVYTEELDALNHHLQEEINERKRAEADLRRSEHEWERTFEAITDAVVILDTQGQVRKMNQATLRVLRGLAPEKSAEEGCRVLFGLDNPPALCPFCRMLHEKQAQCGELHQVTPDRWFYVASYPLFEDDGTLWGGVLIAQDFTEQKRMEQMKDEMISTVSHEMRTPLTAMLGFVEFMLENPVDREQQIDFLGTVHRETERLNELISNFLDLQRLRAEVESYQFEPMDPCLLLSEAAQLYRVASKKHLVRFDCPLDLPKIRGDAKRLMQVLKNLLSNAIKYSPAGGEIFLGAKAQAGQIVICVRDQGLGIPAQDRERIFERFFRVDDNARHITGGIGLGLSLVREIIRAHGGKVWVESEVGIGSTFYISLPVEEQMTRDK